MEGRREGGWVGEKGRKEERGGVKGKYKLLIQLSIVMSLTQIVHQAEVSY